MGKPDSWIALQVRTDGFKTRQVDLPGEAPSVPWRNSASPLLSPALPNSWFREIGLLDLTKYSVGIVSQFYERR
ncbi:MAG TPA: hypothetical protein VJ064_06080 [Limnochordia bacterium]|nr:hypothetical protein [Limnochordia bacterium]